MTNQKASTPLKPAEKGPPAWIMCPGPFRTLIGKYEKISIGAGLKFIQTLKLISIVAGSLPMKKGFDLIQDEQLQKY